MGKYDDSRTNRLRGRLAAAGLRLIGALPLSWNRAFGVMVGWLAWRLGGQSRRVSEINVGLCFPDHSDVERRLLVRDSMLETGKGAAETALCWLKPQQALSRVALVEGDTPLRAALDQGHPVVVLAPHLGCWEIVNFWLSSQFELHAMFKPSHFQAVNDLVLQSREHFNGTFYPATARGVAGLLRALKSGPVITGILPDQVPDDRGGRFAPFFGHPALTGTLPVKLIQQSGARAFLMFAKRLPGTAGYSLVVREADAAIYDPDVDTALAAMNRSVEALVREAPEQYVWNYKRFRRQTDNWQNPYRQ
jgi:Kdo2-lipid IVA lauroyltransferase/acyltransferase